MKMSIKTEEAFAMVLVELEKAKRKHPKFPKDPAEALAIITEEMLELVRVVNDRESKERQKEEASHVAVTAMRFLETMMDDIKKHWEVK